MKRIFKFKKGEITEDLVDTKLYDFLLDYLIGTTINVVTKSNLHDFYPKFKDNFKVTILIEKVKK